ncbi:MAG: ribosome biogenesis GTP-binding protein YihA/YsxC [Verrucomicrobiales bacterium]
MKINSATFVTSAAELDACPPSEQSEIAFIGRSNVGKSSLINFLTGKEGLARTSSKPGHTQLINFFEINDDWTMVDLPGYGYARRSKAQRAEFNEFVSDYLVNRENVLCVFVLIDAKIPPQQLDVDFVEWVVQSELPFALIFTKADKTKPKPLKANIAAFKAELAKRCDGEPAVLSCSVKDYKSRIGVLDFVEQTLKMGG